MGIEITQSTFSDADVKRFGERLELQLEALRNCIATPGFGEGEASIGSELELYIVDGEGCAMHCNEELLAEAGDPQLTLELNRYNLEYNLSPQLLSAGGLGATETEIVDKLASLRKLAATRGAHIVPIGILPTLRDSDFGRECVTDRKRYHALVERLIERRGSEFRIDINGAEPLQLAMSDITLEGANTSFQVHLRVPPAQYVDTYNAVQLSTPLALAVAANSPGIFGHQLWEETRIPLFKQAIDTRRPHRYRWSSPARVNFGHGWARRDASELFAEVVRLYAPLLPVCDPSDEVVRGDPPDLAELRLHQSTVWLWNRPIYDDAAGGHLRVEARALPAGPTAFDMVASAALLLGLAEGLRSEMDTLLPALPFSLADYNFYRAAQYGLDASLVWPDRHQHGLRERPAVDVIRELLPTADAGLASLGVARGERDRYLGAIDARLTRGINGARWQRAAVGKLQNRGVDKPLAFAGMLERYRELSEANEPLAEWPL